jgi:Uma2 family endonuclease
VVVDNEHSREPDVAVQADAAGNLDSTVLDAPVIVAEVTFPSPERDGTGEKLVEYFSVASIHHDLIINPAKRVVSHHARGESGAIVTRIAGSGAIDLNPPGLTVCVAELLPELG